MTALIEPQLPDIHRLAEALRLTARLASLESQTTLVQLALWWSLRRRRADYRAHLRRIEELSARRLASRQEIDPADTLSTDFLATQRLIKETIATLEEADAVPPLRLSRWAARLSARELIEIHRLLGSMRTLILEHDADCSSVLDGRFDSAEALIAAIEKDAA